MRTIQVKGSRLDRVNRGSTLNLKITNRDNTHILKWNAVEFLSNAKSCHILIQLHEYLPAKLCQQPEPRSG